MTKLIEFKTGTLEGKLTTECNFRPKKYYKIRNPLSETAAPISDIEVFPLVFKFLEAKVVLITR